MTVALMDPFACLVHHYRGALQVILLTFLCSVNNEFWAVQISIAGAHALSHTVLIWLCSLGVNLDVDRSSTSSIRFWFFVSLYDLHYRRSGCVLENMEVQSCHDLYLIGRTLDISFQQFECPDRGPTKPPRMQSQLPSRSEVDEIRSSPITDSHHGRGFGGRVPGRVSGAAPRYNQTIGEQAKS
jgi:hypothetical protein